MIPDATARLRRQIAAIAEIRDAEEGSPRFLKWKRDTTVAIEKIFGSESKHLKDFENVRYGMMAFTSGTPQSAHRDRYRKGLDQAAAVLESMISEVEEYGGTAAEPHTPSARDSVLRICERFHLVVRQLRGRHEHRPTLEVEDEYDVQDLLHALLHVFFEDIRREEYTPTYAGGASRMDFLLKREQVVVETKKTRKGLDAKRLGEELLVDIQRYQSHPDCKELICFVCDPDGRIANPRGIERDLSGSKAGINVVVVIAPR